MKRVFFLYFLWVLCLTAPILGRAANPWGILKDVPDETSFSVYAVDNLIDKRPIHYAVSEEVTPQEEVIFKANMLKWPQETLRFIQRSGRAQEFADVVPILQHKLMLIKVSETDSPDIVLSFSDELDDNVAGQLLSKNEDRPFSQLIVSNRVRENFSPTVLHELGHYFGLGDQYIGGRLNSHENFASNANDTEQSIMHGSEATNGQLTCDDADGLINLIDLRLAQRHHNQFSRRAQKGWKSLCPTSNNIYQNARTITRTADAYIVEEDSWALLISFKYDQGRLTREIEADLESPLQLFAVTSKDTVSRDPQNRVTKVVTRLNGFVRFPQQEEGTSADLIWEKQFAYLPLTQRNGTDVIPVKVTELVDGKKLREREVFITSDGGLQNMQMWLTAEGMDVQTATHEIAFALQNQDVVKVGIFNKDISLWLIGIPGEGFFLSKDDGESYAKYAFPPDRHTPPDLHYYYYKVYQPHRSYLMSFYKNFYTPLFGAKSAQADHARQARDQVKQALGTSR